MFAKYKWFILGGVILAAAAAYYCLVVRKDESESTDGETV